LIPLSVMATGRGTVSFKLKGPYGRGSPARFASTLRPVVFWNITYRCNLACIHCYISASPHGLPGELGVGEALRVAGEIAEIGSPMAILSGGEPLVREDFWSIVDRLVSGGVRVGLSTNGTLITRSIAGRLAEAGVSYVGVSLDSVRPGFHDAFRGVPGAFERAVEGIRNSLDAGLPVGLRMTLTRYNIGEARAMVELARKLGVKRIAFYLIDLTGRASGNLELLPTGEQVEGFVRDLISEASASGGDPEIMVVRGNFIGIYAADMLASSKREFLEYLSLISSQGDCGRKTISIYPDGRVRPCQFIDWEVVGDLRRERLRDIISPGNEKLKPYIEAYKNLRGPKCSACPFKVICGGGSRGRARAYTGDPWGDDPLCFIEPRSIAERWGVSEEDIRAAAADT